jgi:hypothetical protein
VETKPFVDHNVRAFAVCSPTLRYYKSSALTRARCHGGVLASFPRKLLKNVSRGHSIGTEEVKRERAELETAFPRCVIIHPEQLLHVCLSFEKGGCFAALRISAHMSGLPRRRERKRDTLLSP